MTLHRYVQFLRNNEFSRFGIDTQIMSVRGRKNPSAQPIKPGSLLKYIKMEELLSSAIAEYICNHLFDDVVNKQQPIKRNIMKGVPPKQSIFGYGSSRG